jgi:hypothetical protein
MLACYSRQQIQNGGSFLESFFDGQSSFELCRCEVDIPSLRFATVALWNLVALHAAVN